MTLVIYAILFLGFAELVGAASEWLESKMGIEHVPDDEDDY